MDPHLLAATLISYARFDQLLSLEDAAFTFANVTQTMNAKLATGRVRRTHADRDEPLRRAVRALLDGPHWPFERIDFAPG
jgi:spore germination protein GerM